MKKSFFKWQTIGFVVTVFSGVLLHFLYEWTNEAIWIAPFTAVNESTWEHMKLLFIPMFSFTIIQSFFFKKYEKFWGVKLKGILLGVLLIPVLFYLYNGIIGKSSDWINIAIFVISAATSFIYEYKVLYKANENTPSMKTSIILLLFVLGLFVLFTFKPLKLAIFEDPTTNTYGIQKQ